MASSGSDVRSLCLCKCSAEEWSGEFMVECDNSKTNTCVGGNWFHPICIGMTKTQVEKMSTSGSWFCPMCSSALAIKEEEKTGALRRSKRTCVRRKRRLDTAAGSPSRKKRRVEQPIQKTTRAPTALQEHNATMQIRLAKLRVKRSVWTRANFNSFEPYLTPSVMSKLKLSEESCADASAPPIEPLSEQPKLLNGGAGATLRDYQLASLNFIRNLRHWGASVILADEMGLGKTIQTLAVIASMLEEQGIRGPHLIICPLSVAEAWFDEARKWLPQMRTVLFHGPLQQRKAIMENKLLINKFDICICTYEVSVAHRGFLGKFIWAYLVLDEAHRIKNENTAWHAALKSMRAMHSLLLTGTPIQNTMHELWALLHFCFPELFVESAPFDDVYEQTSMEHDREQLGKMPKLLQPFYIRRLKSDVELSLPPKEEIIVRLAMSTEQMKWYKLFLSYHANLIDQMSEDYNPNTATEWKKLRALFVQLRKIALHPYLLPNFHDKIVPEQSLVDASGKLQVMDALLTRLKRDGHRVLLFSCFTQVLDLIEVYLAYKRWKYLRLDGSTNRIRRKVDINRFNAPGSDYFVFLISNRAGGLGINLQSADTVIHFDTDWNPQADLQAQARAHRIGQTRMVKIYRFICQDTIEERILFRSQQKLYLDAIVNKGAKMLQDNVVDNFDMGDKDLLATITFGAQKLFQADDRAIGGVDLDALLERSHTIREDAENEKQANESRSSLLKELETNNVRDFNFKIGLVAGNIFQGVEYKKASNVERILNLERRERTTKTRTVNVEGLTFEVGVSSRVNELSTFYQYSSDDIFDKNNRATDLHHESWCWTCDKPLTEEDDDEDIIECRQCCKSFHNNDACWSGELTRMGVYVCGQHQCIECDAKPSQCGMLFRCVGCPRSFCPEDAPLAHWFRPDLGGLHYLDGCHVAEHYGYWIPSSTYMWIACSDECKAYYDTNYGKRTLEDLSLKYDELPEKLLDRLRQQKRKFKKGSPVRRRDIGSIYVDGFLEPLSDVFGREERVRDRLRFLDPYCDIIQELYYLVGGQLPNTSEMNDPTSMDDGKEREDVSPPETPAIPSTIPEDQDVEMKTTANSPKLVPPPVVVPESPVPNLPSHSGVTPMLSNLVVTSFDRDGDIEMKDGKNASVSVSASAPPLRSVSTVATESVSVPKPKPKQKPIDYIGYICAWKGYEPKNIIGSPAYKQEIVDQYERYFKSFCYWKSKSIKTLLDVLGCVIVTQKMSDGEPLLAQVALSHPRQRLAENLACFFLLGDPQFLRISSLDLRR